MAQAKRSMALLVSLGTALGVVTAVSASNEPQVAPRRAPVETLIAEVDLTCSFFLVDEPADFRIAAPARDKEKSVLTDFDLFYAAAGDREFSPDRLWTIVEYGPSIRLGRQGDVRAIVAYMRGRARFVRLEGGRALFRVEKACGPVMVGNGLVPFEEAAKLRGEQTPWDIPFEDGGTATGRVVFLDNEFVQIAAGFWAIINLGAEDGLAVGEQLTVFRKAGAVPPQAVGNIIVIALGPRWATVKALGSKDSILLGDLVRTRQRFRK